ncbi:hypothetical protein FBZ99_11813 [Rhizobium sp. ERR 1071]|nr:hypothetical protein FBZ99_11813 [Rhizobium sp. ERR1071]
MPGFLNLMGKWRIRTPQALWRAFTNAADAPQAPTSPTPLTQTGLASRSGMSIGTTRHRARHHGPAADNRTNHRPRIDFCCLSQGCGKAPYHLGLKEDVRPDGRLDMRLDHAGLLPEGLPARSKKARRRGKQVIDRSFRIYYLTDRSKIKLRMAVRRRKDKHDLIEAEFRSGRLPIFFAARQDRAVHRSYK